MKFIAFLFAIIGAVLNMFQPVISTPASGSVFTGSMYNAFIVIVNHISKNGLPGNNFSVMAMMILVALCIVPLVALIQSVLVLFLKMQSISKSRQISISFFLCALIDGMVAAGIYYVSQESFSSEFFTDYIMPYAQKISFITPAIWAVCYLIASIFARLSESPIPIPKIDPLNLQKGQVIDLAKLIPGTSKLYLGLGWEANKTGRTEFDLDASAFMLTANDRVASDLDFIHYNRREHLSGAILHMGDDRIGDDGNNDNERIEVDLGRVDDTVSKIVFAVTIYDAEERKQNFGQVSKAFVRVVDEANNTECARYNLREKFSTETAVIIAELSRHSGGWSFTAKGEGVKGGLKAVCERYGIAAING